jgi:hypothetical protein
MNCEGFQTVAANMARNEIMEANERAGALAHIDECGRCRQIFVHQTELSEGLRGMADEMKSLQAPPGLEGKVLAAFRDRSRVHAIKPSISRRRYWASAAAAVLLLAFGLLALRWHAASSRTQTNLASSKSGAPVSEPKRDQSTAVDTTGAPSATGRKTESAPKRSRSRRHWAASQLAKDEAAKRSGAETGTIPAKAETEEVATDFVSTGYGSALDLQDGGQLVRVELPRSALTRFGLPMNINRAGERVKAEVLVGQDGLARAIRFVLAVDKSIAGSRPANERNEQ